MKHWIVFGLSMALATLFLSIIMPLWLAPPCIRLDMACFINNAEAKFAIEDYWNSQGMPPGSLRELESGATNYVNCPLTKEPYFYGVLGESGKRVVVLADNIPHQDGRCLSKVFEHGQPSRGLEMKSDVREVVALLLKYCKNRQYSTNILWNVEIKSNTTINPDNPL